VIPLADAGFRVMCVVPASTPEVHWGVVGIASRDVGEYSAETITVLEQIASRVALAVHRIPPAKVSGDQSRDELTPSPGDRERLLLRLTNAVTSERHLPDLLKTISVLLGETIPRHYASLALGRR
jgi:hypothetical protein